MEGDLTNWTKKQLIETLYSTKSQFQGVDAMTRILIQKGAKEEKVQELTEKIHKLGDSIFWRVMDQTFSQQDLVTLHEWATDEVGIQVEEFNQKVPQAIFKYLAEFDGVPKKASTESAATSSNVEKLVALAIKAVSNLGHHSVDATARAFVEGLRPIIARIADASFDEQKLETYIKRFESPLGRKAQIAAMEIAVNSTAQAETALDKLIRSLDP